MRGDAALTAKGSAPERIHGYSFAFGERMCGSDKLPARSCDEKNCRTEVIYGI